MLAFLDWHCAEYREIRRKVAIESVPCGARGEIAAVPITDHIRAVIATSVSVSSARII
jgi:hypothetical protein